MRRFASAVVLMLALLPRPAAALAPLSYVCEDGTHLGVTFSKPGVTPGTATVLFRGLGRQLKLKQVVSADGGRYADGAVEFWIKGDTATLNQDATPMTCRVKR